MISLKHFSRIIRISLRVILTIQRILHFKPGYISGHSLDTLYITLVPYLCSTDSKIRPENSTTPRISTLNFNDADADTSSENKTISRETENRSEVEPLQENEVLQRGFANVTDKLQEIESMFATVALFSGTVFMGRHIAHFINYLYHAIQNSSSSS